jgi:hypothetical protein
MAKVNNATGVYATLGYNFSDPNSDVINLSANTVDFLNSTPQFIESWQARDIADNNVGGYYQNPVAANVNSIITISMNMEIEANTGVSQNIADCELIVTAANNLAMMATSFLAHTNRISGVTPYAGDDAINPYYDNAIGLGKTALYITNQTDNITNTSPILGSFTSILVGPQIDLANTSLTNNLSILTAGVTANTLTPAEITQILSSISSTNNFLNGRQTADVTYYTNVRSFVDKYNTVKKFSSMGDTETYLVNNFVGTDKIKERINSTT